MTYIYHFTDKNGVNGIGAAFPDWIFKAHRPPPQNHPVGAYFTRLTPNTHRLARRLRLPRDKIEFCFEFEDRFDLKSIRGDRGNSGISLYSTSDYLVSKDRQRYNGVRTAWPEPKS